MSNFASYVQPKIISDSEGTGIKSIKKASEFMHRIWREIYVAVTLIHCYLDL
jgi:hypothetical protein